MQSTGPISPGDFAGLCSGEKALPGWSGAKKKWKNTDTTSMSLFLTDLFPKGNPLIPETDPPDTSQKPITQGITKEEKNGQKVLLSVHRRQG
jgi:hypothetical protein